MTVDSYRAIHNNHQATFYRLSQNITPNIMYPLEMENPSAESRCAVAISLGETPLRVSDNIRDLVNTLQGRFADIVFLICNDIYKYEIIIPTTITISKA